MKDELHKNFSQAGAPANSFPGAAEPNFNTHPASQRTGVITAPFRESVTEYTPPPTNLPESVSASQMARRSLEYHNLGPGGSSAPLLGGTQVVEGDNQ
jgi:hypothetical protein